MGDLWVQRGLGRCGVRLRCDGARVSGDEGERRWIGQGGVRRDGGAKRSGCGDGGRGGGRGGGGARWFFKFSSSGGDYAGQELERGVHTAGRRARERRTEQGSSLSGRSAARVEEAGEGRRAKDVGEGVCGRVRWR